MADETPAAPAPEPTAPVKVPATVQVTSAIPGFKFGATHLAGLAGIAYGGNELTQPLIHWAVTGGAPDQAAQSALATIASLLVGGAVIWLARGRAGVAAVLNGDQSNGS